MSDLGHLQREDARTVWANEARHFTPWLAAHLDHLGKALGLELELVRAESDVGDFSIDVLAKDLGRDRRVVIENQLERTDHNHLGQVITYAAGVDAGVVVWICSEFRPEHKQALDWLNHGLSSTTEFYGVVVEILRIDNSKPAVDFRVVASPPDRSRREVSGAAGDEVSPKAARYQAFFQRLIDTLRDKHKFTNARAGQPQSWYSFSSGVRGFHYSVNFPQGILVRVELYIDGGDEDWNLEALHSLRADAASVEREFGAKLDWQELENRRACRIAFVRPGTILDAQDKLDEYLGWAVEHVLKLRQVFGSRIRAIKKPADAPN